LHGHRRLLLRLLLLRSLHLRHRLLLRLGWSKVLLRSLLGLTLLWEALLRLALWSEPLRSSNLLRLILGSEPLRTNTLLRLTLRCKALLKWTLWSGTLWSGALEVCLNRSPRSGSTNRGTTKGRATGTRCGRNLRTRSKPHGSRCRGRYHATTCIDRRQFNRLTDRQRRPRVQAIELSHFAPQVRIAVLSQAHGHQRFTRLRESVAVVGMEAMVGNQFVNNHRLNVVHMNWLVVNVVVVVVMVGGRRTVEAAAAAVATPSSAATSLGVKRCNCGGDHEGQRSESETGHGQVSFERGLPVREPVRGS
jgi:hypothetical protein